MMPTSSMCQFFNQEALSGVVLIIGEQMFFAHKFILAKSSDVFRTMLCKQAWRKGGKQVVQLNETLECQLVFDKFLKYLYTA